jgi:NitT/TauT family transport system ATP-binding protein
MELELKDVSFAYGRDGRVQQALREVSFTVAPHELWAIVGPSGCGKSTLLNLVAGFLVPTSGAVLRMGKKIDRPGAERVMIFQKSALFPFLTVAQNIGYGLRLQRVSPSTRERFVREALDAINLSAFAAVFPRELSEGMRKLVEVARALVLKPPVLLFDESLANLDALARYAMQQRIQELLQEQRTTTLWVTHDLEEAVLLADKVVVLSSRPGTVLDIKSIDLPRPRTEADRTSRALQSIRRELFDLLAGVKVQPPGEALK